MNKSIFFKRELNSITNEDIKELAIKCRDNAPDYLYCIPASTTGKYHASYELGLGGLLRHSLAVTRFLNHFLAIEQYKTLFTDREMDLMRVAAMFHDAIKTGLKGSQYSVQDHPLQGAQFVREQNDLLENPLSKEEIDFCCGCIESHMGEFNKSKSGKEILPKPETEAQKLIHLADYLGSRKDIELLFGFDEEYEDEVTVPELTAEDVVVNFGKYKGMTFAELKDLDPDYIEWMWNAHCDQDNKRMNLVEPLLSFACDYVESKDDDNDIEEYEI